MPSKQSKPLTKKKKTKKEKPKKKPRKIKPLNHYNKANVSSPTIFIFISIKC